MYIYIPMFLIYVIQGVLSGVLSLYLYKLFFDR